MMPWSSPSAYHSLGVKSLAEKKKVKEDVEVE